MAISLTIKPNTFYEYGAGGTGISKDLSLRRLYGDTYDGAADAGAISTAANQKFYIAAGTAPSLQSASSLYWGDEPEFNSLWLQYYPNTVSSSNALSTPRLKVYKVRDNLPLTEGALTVSDENIAAFCSYSDWEGGWMAENFMGTNKGFSDRADYEKEVTSITSWGFALTYRINGGNFRDFMSDQGYWRWEVGGKLRGTQIRARHTLILRQKTNTDGSLTDRYYVTETVGGNIDFDINAPDIAGKSMSVSQLKTYGGWIHNAEVADAGQKFTIYDTEFVGRVTQFNSIFNFVKESPDAEDIKVQTVGTSGDDAKFYTFSRFMLNSTDKQTGANSGQMMQMWENYSGTASKYAKYFGHGDGGATAGTGWAYPQCVNASIDFFPQPVKTDIGGAGGYESIAAKEIEFGLKMEKIPPVALTSGSSNMHFLRGFYIILSGIAPTSTDTFYTFLNKITATSVAATGLWFFNQRTGASSAQGNDDFIYAVSFLDKAYDSLGGTAAPIIDNGTYEGFDYAYPDYNNIGPGDASTKGYSTVLEVPSNEWFTLRFKFGDDGHQDHIMVYCPDVLDSAGKMLSGDLRIDQYPKTNGTVTDITSISIWATNFRAVGAYDAFLQPDVEPDETGFKNDDMEQSVLIDRIVFRNFNNVVKNVSINEQNPIEGFLTLKENLTVPRFIGTTTSPISGNMGVNDNYYGMQNTPTPANFCFGFETKPVTTGTGSSLLLNNYTSIASTPEPISNFYVSGSYSYSGGVGISGQLVVPAGGTPAAAGYFDVTSSAANSIDSFVQKGFVGISGAFADATKRENIYCSARIIGCNADGTEIIVDNSEIFNLPLGKASDGGTDYVAWIVDNPSTNSPTRLIDDFGEYSTGSGSVGFVSGSLYQTKSKNGNIITLNRSVQVSDRGDMSMASSNPFDGAGRDITNRPPSTAWRTHQNKPRLGSIFISPKKYWFNLHIVPGKGTSEWGEWYAPAKNNLYNNVTTRSYGATLLVEGIGSSAAGTPGSTYNEYLYTDGRNQREWSVTNNNEGIFEVSTDYGYGVYQEASEQTDNTAGSPEKFGGYINQAFPESGTYNYIDLTSYIDVESPEFSSAFNFSLYPFFEDSSNETNYTINVDNREGSNKPYMIWGIQDDIPEISDLTVEPAVDVLNMDDPFSKSNADFSNVTFSWSESADDVWYRMLFIDHSDSYGGEGTIVDKYHGARFWAPLNDTGSTHAIEYNNADLNPYQHKMLDGELTNVSGTTTQSITGFQGYGTIFSGDICATPISLSGMGLGGFSGGDKALGTFTAVVHCIPLGTSGTIIDKGKDSSYTDGPQLRIYMSGSKVYTELKEAGELIQANTTTTYNCDTVQPLAIVMTYDKNKINNQFELWVNNILEDSVTVTTPGNLLTADTPTGFMYIGGPASGNSAGYGSNSYFTGYIEEIVLYDKCYEMVPNPGEYIFKSAGLTSKEAVAGGYKAYDQQAKLFAFDYHNIRGKSAREVAQTNQVAWKVTVL